MRRFLLRMANWVRTFTETGRKPARDDGHLAACARFRPALERLEDRQLLTVTYHGGPLLTNVGVESLFLGQAWQSNSTYFNQAGTLDGYLQFLTNSSYMDMLTQAGYNVGRGQWLDGVIDPASLSSSVSDGQIQSDLQVFINDGYLQSPDSNRLYVVFVAPNVVVTARGASSASGFLGYHDSFIGTNGAAINYAVIPYPGGSNGADPNFSNPIDSMTVTTSHELAEAVTDPQPNGTLGWFDDTWVDPGTGQAGAEIGDIVATQFAYLNGWAIQAVANQNDQAVFPAGSTSTRGTPATTPDILFATGQTFDGTVVGFSDPDTPGAPGSFTAQINWGDGQISVGQIIDHGNGNYTVSGSHTYVRAGLYTIQVQLSDTDGDVTGASSTASVLAIAHPGPLPVHLYDAASGLTQSAEYYTNLIIADYQHYLGRGPDVNGLAYWLGRMQSGLTDEQLEAGFIGSAEYIQNHGGTGEAWVVGLYQDVLGRTPDATGLSYWLTQLHQGATPYSIAYGFAASAEREGQRVVADYQRYLGRLPSAAEVNAWVDQFINHGQTNERVIAGFIASGEYYQDHYSDPRDWLFAAYQATLGRDPDAAGLEAWLNVLASP